MRSGIYRDSPSRSERQGPACPRRRGENRETQHARGRALAPTGAVMRSRRRGDVRAAASAAVLSGRTAVRHHGAGHLLRRSLLLCCWGDSSAYNVSAVHEAPELTDRSAQGFPPPFTTHAFHNLRWQARASAPCVTPSLLSAAPLAGSPALRQPRTNQVAQLTRATAAHTRIEGSAALP
jgi:hypothetical protein